MKAKELFAQQRKHFLDPRQSLSEGLVEVSDQINSEILLEAYSFGIFPWPQDGLPILWFCPESRGILKFSELKLSKSFKKFLKQTTYKISMNECFDQVIEECALQSRPGQEGTWINQKLISAYKEFHRAGYAHSIEAWDNKRLVGGLYGVYVGGVFCGESMFFKESEASKFCLYHLIEKLKSEGIQWMDIQMVTPLLESWGGQYVKRDEYLDLLERSKAQAKAIDFKTKT